MNFKKFQPLLILVITFLFSIQLTAQSLYNSFDRAPALNHGTIEATGTYADQTFFFDGESQGVSNTFGLKTGYGFGSNFDLKLSWSALRFNANINVNFNFFTLSPKYSFGRNKFAVALPVSVFRASFMGESESDFMVSPELMFNSGINKYLEIGVNARLIILVDDDTENLIGLGLGIGVSSDLNKWIARPELGILFNPGEEGMFLSPGLSFSYFIGTKKDSTK